MLRSWSDRAAVERLRELFASPREVVSTIRDHIHNSFARLYRQRNLILHAGRTQAVALRSTLRGASPLVGAGLDRISQARFVSGMKPLQLAGRARTAIENLKTIVFCVDQEHAEEMRKELNNCNSDLVQQYPDYVVRIVSDEGHIGRGYLSRFMELETTTPTIVTTSQMLTTGVDVQTCKNIVLVRTINSMTEFKQIIGRGTRVRDDYGKMYFDILDYTGSATRLFADKDFDGDPALVTESTMDESGETVGAPEIVEEQEATPEEIEEGAVTPLPPDDGDDGTAPRKFYVDGGTVEIAAHLVYDLDADGKRLQVKKFTDYTGEKVRNMYPSAAELRAKWSNGEERAAIIESLRERGITFEELAEAAKQPDADPFDLLCHVAYSAPIRTRRERAATARDDGQAFFSAFTDGARQVLDELLEKYVEFGAAQFQIPDALKVPPISQHGNVIEIAALFGGGDKLRSAVDELQRLLYVA